jgi:hypothetical protein
MYMRYAGGGVGHYRVTLSDTPANAIETTQDLDMGREEVQVEEGEHILLEDNIEDHHSDSEGEEEDEENPDKDDLGAEDGEGGFVDAEDEEGYAAL